MAPNHSHKQIFALFIFLFRWVFIIATSGGGKFIFTTNAQLTAPPGVYKCASFTSANTQVDFFDPFVSPPNPISACLFSTWLPWPEPCASYWRQKINTAVLRNRWLERTTHWLWINVVIFVLSNAAHEGKLAGEDALKMACRINIHQTKIFFFLFFSWGLLSRNDVWGLLHCM